MCPEYCSLFISRASTMSVGHLTQTTCLLSCLHRFILPSDTKLPSFPLVRLCLIFTQIASTCFTPLKLPSRSDNPAQISYAYTPATLITLPSFHVDLMFHPVLVNPVRFLFLEQTFAIVLISHLQSHSESSVLQLFKLYFKVYV